MRKEWLKYALILVFLISLHFFLQYRESEFEKCYRNYDGPPGHQVVCGREMFIERLASDVPYGPDTEEDRSILRKYREEAKNVSSQVLIDSITQDSQDLLVAFNRETALRESAFESELYSREVKDKRVVEAHEALLEKYGPCFGVPRGDCKE